MTDPRTGVDAAIVDAIGLHEADVETGEMTLTIDKMRRRVRQLETQLGDVVSAATRLQRQLDQRDTEIARLRRRRVHVE